MKRILITGGAGFVGSSLALRLQAEFPRAEILCLDNLYRRGSHLNRRRIEAAGLTFLRGDVRERQTFALPRCDLVLDAAAEPSVLAGRSDDCAYVVDTNLGGTVNVLEAARGWGAAVLFLSTSRVYPVPALNAIALRETDSRYEIADRQILPGISPAGISESFPLEMTPRTAEPGAGRTLYGATKYASEIMVREYAAHFGIPTLVNRCGVLAGPWQMGRVDQGVIALWVAAHLYGKPLSYIGYGGKQVRDLLHVDDLAGLVVRQLHRIPDWQGDLYNVGGGPATSLSLRELTRLVQRVTGQSIPIGTLPDARPGDIPLYLTDSSRAARAYDWAPARTAEQIVADTAAWLTREAETLRPVFAA